MELRFEANDNLIKRLQDNTHVAKGADLGRDALVLLDWAVQEAKAGRRLSTSDGSGTRYVPVLPVLNDFPYAGE